MPRRVDGVVRLYRQRSLQRPWPTWDFHQPPTGWMAIASWPASWTARPRHKSQWRDPNDPRPARAPRSHALSREIERRDSVAVQYHVVLALYTRRVCPISCNWRIPHALCIRFGVRGETTGPRSCGRRPTYAILNSQWLRRRDSRPWPRLAGISRCPLPTLANQNLRQASSNAPPCGGT